MVKITGGQETMATKLRRLPRVGRGLGLEVKGRKHCRQQVACSSLIEKIKSHTGFESCGSWARMMLTGATKSCDLVKWGSKVK